jgi:hypothetical protein
MYSSTHSLTSALDGGEWSASRPGRFTPRERAPIRYLMRKQFLLQNIYVMHGKALPVLNEVSHHEDVLGEWGYSFTYS